MSEVVTSKGPSTWRIVLAAIFDFFTAFWIFGLLIASIFGGSTDGGFNLQGGPAILLFFLIVAYFVIFNKFLGGTIWKRILRAKR
ncbi:hypothetical protein EPK99_19745 [Neorhizobium lilium]|uniref:RDD family protein n=1 Tax=Neorhizobium lilium TaxID=2503024 RepID=A0A444LDJ4_9HYPH|nr:hypothetical protein [Neorhizobium lilium]RWX75912.1 hypothetical protein EPK99_19745 [Neorhizobium lilium]